VKTAESIIYSKDVTSIVLRRAEEAVAKGAEVEILRFAA
jgi:hypothetical protein